MISASQIVALLASAVISFVVGAMGNMILNRNREIARLKADAAAAKSAHDQAMEEGMKAVLRSQIVDAYEKHVVDGRPLSVERKHELDNEYRAYDALGGNGTGKDMYEAICEMQVAILK